MTQTLTLRPAEATSQDVRIVSSDPTGNYNDASLSIGEDNTTTSTLRTLIKFDLSSLPSNAKVSTATLSLTLKLDRSSNARTFRVYRMKRSWGEAATWNTYDGTNNWTTAGGFASADCEQTDIGSLAFTAAETIPSVKSWSLTPAAIDEIAAGTFTNNGFMMKADTESNDAYSFESSQDVDDADKPTLVIEYNYQTSLAGSITPAGSSLIRDVGKQVAGVLTPIGALAKGIFVSIAGALTPTGLLGSIFSLNRDSRHIVQTLDARQKVNTDDPGSTVRAAEGRKNVNADTWRNT